MSVLEPIMMCMLYVGFPGPVTVCISFTYTKKSWNSFAACPSRISSYSISAIYTIFTVETELLNDSQYCNTQCSPMNRIYGSCLGGVKCCSDGTLTMDGLISGTLLYGEAEQISGEDMKCYVTWDVNFETCWFKYCPLRSVRHHYI
jgi:hypothetical protein